VEGCDVELMFEAVPRIELEGGAAMAKAATLISDAFNDEDPDNVQLLVGDLSHSVSAADLKAFVAAFKARQSDTEAWAQCETEEWGEEQEA